MAWEARARGLTMKIIWKSVSENEDAEINPSRYWTQLVVRRDSDLCRAVVRRLVHAKPVRASRLQSGYVYEQMCPCVSAEARTGLAR
jgi:hypothetical protein